MEMLLQSLRGFLRRVHLDALNQGSLAVMISLMDRKKSCMELATDTGYDRTTIRQILQRLRQQWDVDLWAYRSPVHGQVEYVYYLTEKGTETLRRCLEEFNPLMARIALEGMRRPWKDVERDSEEEVVKSEKSKKEGGEGEKGKSGSLLV